MLENTSIRRVLIKTDQKIPGDETQALKHSSLHFILHHSALKLCPSPSTAEPGFFPAQVGSDSMNSNFQKSKPIRVHSCPFVVSIERKETAA